MKSLVIAPHPDDELLGCGGTLLKRADKGATVGWILMTAMSTEKGWSKEQIAQRDIEIQCIRESIGISANHLYRLDYPTAELDKFPTSTVIGSLAKVFKDFQPEEVYLPHPGDIHSDHRITFDAAAACTKWFRYPSIKRVLTYETLSETELSIDLSRNPFLPNLFVDITDYITQKQKLLSIYASEIQEAPFPRSLDVISSLASIRGAQMGVMAAEAFAIVRQFE